MTKREQKENEGKLKICREKFSGELESQLFDRIQNERKSDQEENIVEIKTGKLVEKPEELNSSSSRLGKNQLLLLLLLSVIKASVF